jgi:hypothetical protein
MYPVSPEFLTRVRSTHIAPVSVELWDTVSNSQIRHLYPINGSVKVNSKDTARRSVTMEIPDVDGTLVPENGFSDLSPFNREVKVYRGVRLADGTDELVPLGVFIITSVKVFDGETGVMLSIEGTDRSLRIARNKWSSNTFWIDENTPKETAIANILKDRWPDVKTDFIATRQVTAVLYPTLDQNSDPWRKAVEIADSAGMDLYFDALGVARLRTIPDPDTAAVDATYEDGAEAIVVSLTRELTTDGTANGVIYTGEGSNLTIGVIGEAWDTNPASPTYRTTYGDQPVFLSSPTVLTVEDAKIAAEAELRKRLGATEKIDFGAVVNPAHDVFDVIQLTRADSKIDTRLIIESLEIPLLPDQPMTATARARRFV